MARVAGQSAFTSFFLTQAILSGYHHGLSLSHPGMPRAVLSDGTLLFGAREPLRKHAAVVVLPAHALPQMIQISAPLAGRLAGSAIIGRVSHLG